MMATKRKRGQTVHSEGRNIIRNIIHVCEEEKRRKSTIIDLQKAMARVALYANISEKTAVSFIIPYRSKSVYFITFSDYKACVL